MKYTETEPDYDFQSAMWETTDDRRVVIERTPGPQNAGKYNAVVIDPDEGGRREPATVLAQNVTERAADKAAREWLTSP